MSLEQTLEQLFDSIHRKQAEGMLKLLEKGGLAASEMNAINKFLADNNVTGIKNDNPGLKKLSEGLAAFEESGQSYNN